MSGKNYPCDGADGFCPYEESDNAESMYFCYNHCGLGSDEDYSPYSPDWEDESEYEDYEDDVSEIGYNPYLGCNDDDC